MTKKNEFDNYIGVPASIPEVIPFSMTSYEYFYRNLEESDEMVLWHCIAAWLCCTDPNKSFHDPFVTDEIKKAKKEYKVADVHIFGDKIEIDNERKKINTENISNNESMKITKRELKQMINESVYDALNEELLLRGEESQGGAPKRSMNRFVKLLDNMLDEIHAISKNPKQFPSIDFDGD